MYVLPVPLLKLQLGHDDAVSLQMFSDAPNYFRAISMAASVLYNAVAQLLTQYIQFTTLGERVAFCAVELQRNFHGLRKK